MGKILRGDEFSSIPPQISHVRKVLEEIKFELHHSFSKREREARLYVDTQHRFVASDGSQKNVRSGTCWEGMFLAVQQFHEDWLSTKTVDKVWDKTVLGGVSKTRKEKIKNSATKC